MKTCNLILFSNLLKYLKNCYEFLEIHAKFMWFYINSLARARKFGKSLSARMDTHMLCLAILLSFLVKPYK